MLKSKATLLGFCSLFGLIGLKAQDCHLALRGHVTELGQSEPLAYATVFVREIAQSTVTDENGWFAFPNLCEKTAYTIEIRHIECAHFTQIVRLTENTQMDFQLKHDAVLNEVLIVEKAITPRPSNAEVIVNQSDLEAGKGQNLSETLRKVSGVSILSSGATVGKPVIQGLHSNRIAIVSDGVTLQSQQWGNDHAPEIDPFTAEKITVVKGAAGVRYGVGAMAGVIVLEPADLRSETGVDGWLSIGGFSNGRGGVAAGSLDWRPKRGNVAFRLQGTAKKSGNLRAPDYWLGNTGLEELNFSVLAAWKGKHWRHTMSLSQFGQSYGILRAAHTGSLEDLRAAIASDTPRNNLNEFTYLIDRPKQQVQHNVLKYRTEFRFNEVWKLSGQYSFQYNQRREYDRGRKSVTAADLAQVSFQLWSNALDVALEHLPIHHWQGGIGVQANHQLNYVSKGGYIPNYQAFGGSVWATERWRRFPIPWEYEAGIRFDYRWNHATTSGNGLNNLDKKLAFGNVSGSVGAIYHINSKLLAKLNTGYAWRPPHVNELFARGIHHGTGTYEQGNPNLLSEKAWNTNATLDWKSNRCTGSLSLYRNQIRDFIYVNQPRDSVVLTIRGPFPAYFYQQDHAVIQGMDASLAVDLTRQWTTEAQLSLLRGWRMAHRSTSETSTFKDWLPLMPSDRFQYGIRWNFQGPSKPATGDRKQGESFVRLMASTQMRQTRIPSEGLTKAAPASFTLLNLEAVHSFKLKLFKRTQMLDVGLSIQNLGNARYREYLDLFRYYADATGTNVALRAKVKF